MADKQYIERDTCRDVLMRFLNSPCIQCGDYPSIMSVETCIKLFDSVPAADVVEVVHGEWFFRNDGRYAQTRCYCSACGKHSGIGGIRTNQMKPYCPNCGAKMDGGKHDE